MSLENHKLKQKYDELSEKYNLLQQELIMAQAEHNNKQSDHVNRLHFLQNKNEDLNKTIFKKNKQISGLLSSKKRFSPSISEDSDSDTNSKSS